MVIKIEVGLGNTDLSETIKKTDKLDNIVSKYSEIFDEKLGTIKDYQAHLRLKEHVMPKFCKASSPCTKAAGWTRIGSFGSRGNYRES